jgi:hypothetical protein
MAVILPLGGAAEDLAMLIEQQIEERQSRAKAAIAKVLERPATGDKPSKMSRLIQRDTILGALEDLDRGQRQLDAEMLTAWEGKWAPKA